MTTSPSVQDMRPRVAQVIAFVLTLPVWVLMVVCILYQNYLSDFGLPFLIMVVVSCIAYLLSVTLSLCLPDFSGRDTKLLLVWEAIPILLCIIFGLWIFVERISDIGDWIFMAVVGCIIRIIFGNG